MFWGRLFAVIFTIGVVGGCATPTTPTPTKEATDVPNDRLYSFRAPTAPESAKAVVVRDTGILASGCFYALWIDGTLAARFDPGEKGEFHVLPGERLLKVGRDPQGKGICALDGDNWTQRESIFRPNETKYFRLRIGSDLKTDIERTDP